MKKSIVHFPNSEKGVEEALKGILEYIEEVHDGKVAFGDPNAFVTGWATNKIKIYVAKEAANIKGVAFVLLVQDPILDKKIHAILSFAAGADMTTYINTTLEVYGASI